jgi:glyoxylase-like metal-dependent hydrolase (beta-lactamase superfamily II)
MLNKNIIRLVVGPIETNCWIYPINNQVNNYTQVIIIDPGAEADTIISTLKKNNLVPKYILLTHGHFDHIGALPDLMAAFSADPPEIAIHSLDSEYLGERAFKTHSISIKAAMADTFLGDSFVKNTLANPIPSPDRLLEEGDRIGPLTVLHLPGHTKGSIAFWDEGEGVLFTGDTLFLDSYGRTDLPGGNRQHMLESLRRLFSMDGSIKVYPGHDETTTIGHEAKNYR